MMQWSDVPFQPSRSMLRQFGVIGLVLLSALAAWRTRAHGIDAGVIVMSVLALVLGAAGIIRPVWLRPIFVAWVVAAFPIGWAVSQLIMAIMYYLVITPIGLVLRMTGWDALRLKRRHAEASYWQPKPTVENLRRYYQQF